MIRIINSTKASVSKAVVIESTDVWIERSTKASAYFTEATQVVLRPLFENNKIGNPIPLSEDVAGELLKASEDYNHLESIAWNANNVVFKHFERGSKVDEDTITVHQVLLAEALEEGKQVLDNCAKVFKSINEKVEFYDGKLPNRILVFSNGSVSARYRELNSMIEDNWEYSKIKQRLSYAKKTLDSLKRDDVIEQLRR